MANKRRLDPFDLEAEREGNAIRASNSLRVSKPTSKRLTKARQKTDRAEGKIDNRIQKRVMQ